MSLAHKCLLTDFSTLETKLIAQKTSLSQYESEVPFQTGVQSSHKLLDVYHGTDVTSASTLRHLRINAQMQKAILHGDTCSGSVRILSQFRQLSLCNEYVPRNMKRNHKDFFCMNRILFSSQCAIQIWKRLHSDDFSFISKINRSAKTSDTKNCAIHHRRHFEDNCWFVHTYHICLRDELS